jgi:alkyl sulfatase BDS1-like metallo-beta-lactamase superfamily hydrolase
MNRQVSLRLSALVAALAIHTLVDAQVSTPPTAVGPKGEVANAELIAHSAQFARRTYKVADGVHTVVGYGLANATVIEGRTGLIVVDTGDSIQMAKEQLEQIRKVSDKPVRAVIYSHNHYALGAQAYVNEGGGQPVQFIAHPKLLPNMANQVADTGPAFLRNAMMQFGVLLPPKGPDAMPNMGVGPFLIDLSHGVPQPAFVPPTRTVNDGEEFSIDGVTLLFLWTPSDTDDTIAIYLPQRKVLVSNLIWPAFFNVHTLRGDRFRDPQTILPGLRRVMALDAEANAGVHGAPIMGREAVRRAATAWHDGLQFVYDQTVRGINRGRSPDDLAREVKLPASIAGVPAVREFYGELPFHVRQVYSGLLGWWGGDMADAHRLHRTDEAARLIELVGGADKVEAAARAAFAKGDTANVQWAAQLATYLVATQPTNAAWRQFKADTLRKLGQTTTAATTRNWYISQALQLEGKIDPFKLPFSLVSENQVLGSPPITFVNALRFQLDPASQGPDTSLVLRFTDIGKAYRLQLRNSIVEVTEADAAPADLTLAMTFKTWAGWIVGKVQLPAALASGEVKLEGSPERLNQTLSRFDFARAGK